MSDVEYCAVSAWYGRFQALNNVNVRMRAGEFTAIVGPNGSGKSTLLNMLAGIRTRMRGTVSVGGDDLARLRPRERARRIGVLGQRQAVQAGLTVAELVDLGMPVTRSWLTAPPVHVEQALQRTGCTALASADPTTLSGGQLQRVLLARALVHQPAVLVLDEPTNHLDPFHRLELLDLVTELDVTVLAVMHDLDLASRYADRVVVLDAGVVVADDQPSRALNAKTLSKVFSVTGTQATRPVADLVFNSGVSELIDTTEMYLRTIFELEEEGIVPLRARIAERLHQSGPTVSQTVARMERDGLLSVEGDRHLEFSEKGRQLATRVMRKHRLAERLLTDLIGLEIEHVHDEACRWEHVMSENVERRLLDLLEHPTESPYGNPIPGLEELGEAPNTTNYLQGVSLLTDAVKGSTEARPVVIRRIAEELQKDVEAMAVLSRVGALPGNAVLATQTDAGIELAGQDEIALIDLEAANYLFVEN